MTDNFEKKVAVDGPVVNAGELGSSTFSPGQALPAGPLGLGQRWTVARKREVVLRLLRDEPVQLLSRQLGVEIFRLEQWREKAIGGIDVSVANSYSRSDREFEKAPAMLFPSEIAQRGEVVPLYWTVWQPS